ncbi:uncharacterized protein AB675_7677 [Cyphellophora attinorum]|uniref:Uncharacterized protein n=1 Tax=Cyphellophora attinorum TaxID=1664694 RepID=A0A0N1P0G5_9EURO|nr:uncharacterized protein AB675_7677 [Phialophora attinorum]KPI40286.1 hypothetical protein AB675_7677 [Phialophora attinorum]
MRKCRDSWASPGFEASYSPNRISTTPISGDQSRFVVWYNGLLTSFFEKQKLAMRQLQLRVNHRNASVRGIRRYAGYNLTVTGDNESVLYETDNTATSNPDYPPPDVYLNASVHVGEIDILVRELSAKINIDAQVLQLLEFNAGVDVSVERIRLQIQNVTAKVELTARLENLVKMVSSVLDSVDLNPILAELGDLAGGVIGGVGDIVGGVIGDGSSSGGSPANGSTTGAAPSASLSERGLFNAQLANGILYAINNYEGNAHTNRVLDQNGDLVDQSLDNGGIIYNQRIVGRYDTDMEFTGQSRTGVVVDGIVTTEKEYVYRPFPGITLVAQIFVSEAGGEVVATRLISEVEGGGSSIIESVSETTAA